MAISVLGPADGASLEVDAVRLLGQTREDAAVVVNGQVVVLDESGRFISDVLLDPGANLIEVTAAVLDEVDEIGNSSIVVFSNILSTGLPLSMTYPADGLITDDLEIHVIGGTNPDATVVVNGVPVEVNQLGLFSTVVTLVDGPNLIEITAVDLSGESRTELVTVFVVAG